MQKNNVQELKPITIRLELDWLNSRNVVHHNVVALEVIPDCVELGGGANGCVAIRNLGERGHGFNKLALALRNIRGRLSSEG